MTSDLHLLFTQHSQVHYEIRRGHDCCPRELTVCIGERPYSHTTQVGTEGARVQTPKEFNGRLTQKNVKVIRKTQNGMGGLEQDSKKCFVLSHVNYREDRPSIRNKMRESFNWE